MKAGSMDGFTLWELLVTLFVAGILFGLGVPSFLELRRNNTMTTATNDLVGAILLARTEAVKRQVPVSLCMSANPLAAVPACDVNAAVSNGGFVVWVDENGNVDPVTNVPLVTDATDGNVVIDAGEIVLLRRQDPAPPASVAVSANSGYIAYGPDGFRRNVAVGPGISASWVLYCDVERGNRLTSGDVSTSRAIRIDAPGRGQVVRSVGEITQAMAAIPAACP
jgi:type IV fimbrial biogenesis protein FimT